MRQNTLQVFCRSKPVYVHELLLSVKGYCLVILLLGNREREVERGARNI